MKKSGFRQPKFSEAGWLSGNTKLGENKGNRGQGLKLFWNVWSKIAPGIEVSLKLVPAVHKKGVLADISYLEVCGVRPWKVISVRCAAIVLPRCIIVLFNVKPILQCNLCISIQCAHCSMVRATSAEPQCLCSWMYKSDMCSSVRGASSAAP